MANYFQDPAQSFVPTPVYKPDFSALQNTLTAKQQKFDAGISAVRSIRNSVFNAPVTKGENADVKNQYLAEAEQKLKHLSEVDLSKESNVQEARGVFGNFFKDREIAFDMAYTERQNSAISQFDTFKPAKDSFEFADQRNLGDMRNGVEKVRNAKRGDLSVYEVRDFVPFTDMTKYISKLAADEKFAVESIDDNGMTTQKRTNGAKSIGNWTTFVDAATQGKFNNQFRVEARYAKEEAVKMAKTSHARDYNGAEIDDDEALRNVIRNNYKTQFERHGTIVENYNQQINVDKKVLNEYVKDHSGDSDFKEKATSFKKQLEAREAAAADYVKEQKKFDPKDKNYESNMKDFMDNPNGFFYSQIRTNSITNMAHAFAMNEKVEEPKVNALYKQNYDQFKDERGYQLDVEKLKLDREKNENSKQEGSGSGSGGTGLNADGTKMSAGEKKAAGFEEPLFQGNSYDNVNKISSAQRFTNETDRLHDAGYNPILDPNQIGGVLADASNGAINYGEVVTYLSALNSNRKKAQFTKEELAINDKVSKVFKSNGINVDNDNRYGQGRAILALAGKHLADASNSEKWGNEKYIKVMNSYNESKYALETLSTLQKKKNEGLKSFENLDDYKNLILKTNNGNQIVTAQDMAKEFSDFTMMDFAAARTMVNGIALGVPGMIPLPHINRGTAKKDDAVKMKILQAYRDNTLKFRPDKLDFRVTLNSGEVYKFDEQTKKDFEKMAAKFGTPEELSKKLKRMDETSSSSVPGFTNSEGQIGQVFQFPFSKDTDGNEKGVRIISQVLQAGKTDIALVNGQSSDKYDDLLNNLKGQGSASIKSQLEPPSYHTKGSNGKPTIVLKFKPMNEKEEKEMAKKYGLEIEDLRNSIELPLREGDNAPDLKPLLHPNNGFYVYDKLNKGETISSDKMEKDMGFEYTITPSSRNNPVSARVHITRKIYDPATRTMIAGPVIEEDFDLKKVDPDSMMRVVKQSFSQHLDLNRNAYKVTEAENKKPTDLQKSNLAWWNSQTK